MKTAARIALVVLTILMVGCAQETKQNETRPSTPKAEQKAETSTPKTTPSTTRKPTGFKARGLATSSENRLCTLMVDERNKAARIAVFAPDGKRAGGFDIGFDEKLLKESAVTFAKDGGIWVSHRWGAEKFTPTGTAARRLNFSAPEADEEPGTIHQNPGSRFFEPLAFFVDAADNVFVGRITTHFTRTSISFGPFGNLPAHKRVIDGGFLVKLSQDAKELANYRDAKHPIACCIDNSGRVVLLDRAGRAVVFSADGGLLRGFQLAGPRVDEKQQRLYEFSPEFVAVDWQAERVYIGANYRLTDEGIEKAKEALKELTDTGPIHLDAGKGEIKLDLVPRTEDPKTKIARLEAFPGIPRAVVQLFDLQGAAQGTWLAAEERGPNSNIAGLALLPQGKVCVLLDEDPPVVVQFNTQGKLLTRFEIE